MRTTTQIGMVALCYLLLTTSQNVFAAFCTDTTLVTISGILTDGSGPADYDNNSNCTWLIEPPAVSTVTLTFTFFDVAAGDQVRIYDGSTTAAPLLGTFSGTTLPAPITSSAGVLLVEFVTDASGVAEGWNATYATSSAGLYWIGGDGDYDDPAHWSTSSGGISCGCIPTANDNVFFDANSFTGYINGVNILGDVYCRSMDWTGANLFPVMMGNGDLHIFGSLIMDPMVFHSFSGRIYFEADSLIHVIQSSGVELDDIYMEGEDGTWLLLDDLNADQFYLNNGNFFTQSNDMELTIFQSSTSNTRGLNLGNSEITMTGTSFSTWSINSTNLAFDAGTSHIRYLFGTNGSHPSAGGVDLRYHDVTFLGTGGSFTAGYARQLHFANSAGIYSVSGVDSVFNLIFEGYGTLSGSSSLFNDVQFNQGGALSCFNAMYGSLQLTAGKEYTFTSSGTHTVLGNMTSNGTCDQPIILRSISTTSPATIAQASGTLNVDYCRLTRLTATGAASFNAFNSTDLGGNLGWNIVPPSGTTLYWIGGYGNWSDPAHWSLTSGGVSAGCIPTPFNNVVFDGNSFSGGGQGVVVDEEAYCGDFNWNGALFTPDLIGSQHIHIYGSFLLQSDLTLNYTGDFILDALAGNYGIRTAGQIIDDIDISGPAQWTLLDSLYADDLRLVEGTLRTAGVPVNVNRFSSSGSLIRKLDLGISDMRMRAPNSSAWSINETNFTVIADRAHMIFKDAGSTSSYPSLNGNYSWDRVTFRDNWGAVNNADSVGFLVFGGNGLGRVTNVDTINSIISNSEVIFSTKGYFRDAKLFAGGTFNNVLYFEDLELSSGNTYVFQSSGTTHINGVFQAVGNCAEIIILESSSPTSTGKISRNSGSLNISYASLERIEGVGGATFNATNSTDNGGNINWNLTAPAPLNLYWIGASGNWNDISNWSFSSGGPGGACLPTRNDDVFFDLNSFSDEGQGVNIDADAFCRSMTWSGVNYEPALYGNGALFISGSLTLDPSMFWLYKKELTFEASTPGWTISSNGKVFREDIRFAGAGTWTLSDQLICRETITLEEGGFFTDGYPLTTREFRSQVSNTRFLDFDTSAVIIKYYYDISGTGITVLADQATIIQTSDPSYFYGGGYLYGDVFFKGDLQYLRDDDNQFDRVVFSGDGDIDGHQSYNYLVLSANRDYEFQAGKTQSIVQDLIAVGVPEGRISIHSSSTSNAFFEHFGAPLCLEYVELQDMTAFGSFFFAGKYSFDLGDNPGWFFTNCEDACPVILDPVTEFIGPTSAVLTWTEGPNTFQYVVRIRPVGSPFWTTVNLPPGSVSSYQVTALTLGQDYEWQVRSVCDSMAILNSLWSDTTSFVAQCSPPGDLFPSLILSNAARLTWDFAAEAEFYELRGRKLGTAIWTALITPEYPFFYDVVGLQPATTYEWQMRTSCNISGTLVSDYSSTNVFSTSSGGKMADVEDPFNSTEAAPDIYPNPFDDHLIVDWGRIPDGIQTIRLVDMMGRVVRELKSGNGVSELFIQRHDLPAGLYLLEISGQGHHVIPVTAQ